MSADRRGVAPDVLVVGAGIVGAACAEALVADGFSVDVLEADFPGSGTTAAAMGHIVVMDDSAAQMALTAYSRELWSRFELPSAVADERRGTLWIAEDAAQLAHVDAKAAVYRAAGVGAEVLDGRALAEAEPNLRDGLAGALLVPDDRVVYPPSAARWLLDRARAAGARVRSGVEALELAPRRVRTRDGWLEAGAVVNAAGIAAKRLTPALPIEPRKGHLVITDRVDGFCGHQLVELAYLASAHGADAASVAFNVQPRATGQLLVGSSREFVGLDASTNRRLLGRMLRRALAFLPGLARVDAVRTWIGFRPCTPDNLPCIGALDDGLFVAAGHEGLGVTTSLGTARLVADALAGRTPAIDPAPYAPGRAFGTLAHG